MARMLSSRQPNRLIAWRIKMHVLSLEEIEDVYGGVSLAGLAVALMTPVSAPVAVGVIAFTAGVALVGGYYYAKQK